MTSAKTTFGRNAANPAVEQRGGVAAGARRSYALRRFDYRAVELVNAFCRSLERSSHRRRNIEV